MVNLLSQQLLGKGIGVDVAAFTEVLKSEREIADMINPNLEWDTSKDPSLLFGRLIERGYEDLFDASKFAAFKQRLEVLRAPAAAGRVLLVYGSGCLVEEVRGLYDIKCYFDVTPKEAILRIRRGQFANLGDKVAAPANRVIRRCYYADFEMGVRHRGKLLRGKLLDYYMASDRPDHIHMIPMEALSDIFRSLACYPFRCKPVYLEGVWGGTYVKKLRNLPDTMRNCAWVFDLIPMEVSIVVEAGDEKIDFPISRSCRRRAKPSWAGRASRSSAATSPSASTTTIRSTATETCRSRCIREPNTTRNISANWAVRTRATTWWWPDRTPRPSWASASMPTPSSSSATSSWPTPNTSPWIT